LVAFALAFEPGHQQESYIFAKFQTFLKDFNKKYTTIEEYNERFLIFKKNYLETQQFALNPTTTHSVGITKFFDLTIEEFRSQYLGLRVNVQSTIKHKYTKYPKSVSTAPDAWDWRDHGAVSPVKDQGGCGSCWAFSAIGNLEGLYARKTQQIMTFSEQELVDCDTYDYGCGGGWMENAFKWIEENGGEENDTDYPYSSGTNKNSCQFDKSKAQITLKSHSMVSSDEEEIKEQLYTVGPLSVALNASSSLMGYTGGIINLDASSCDPARLDHGVTLVGYGTEDGQDFWILKNSWNTNWVEQGFFRMARGSGVCGVNTHVVTATLN